MCQILSSSHTVIIFITDIFCFVSFCYGYFFWEGGTLIFLLIFQDEVHENYESLSSKPVISLTSQPVYVYMRYSLGILLYSKSIAKNQILVFLTKS